MKIVKLKKCITCKKFMENHYYYPFCSKKCSEIDLGRWLLGNYYFTEDSKENKN